MDEIQIDTSSDIHFLENEKFDFDLPFSPSTLPENKIDKKENDDDDDEVFFGPVCFTEKCISPEVTSVQEDTIKPLSPLSGEQIVEVFTEATKVALHFERLSTKTSDTSLNQSHVSSGRSSLSNSYLKSNCSSSSSSVLQFSFEKVSSGSSDGKPSLSDMGDMDKENTQPVTYQGTKTRQAKKDDKGSTKIKDVSPLVSKQSNTPVVKNKKSLPKPAVRASRLPKSKNTEKTCSAFNSPIKEPDVAKTDNLKTSDLAKIKTQSIGKSTRKRSEHNIQKSVPTKTSSNMTNRKKTSSTTLAKRNIFCSTESLTEDGTKQTKSCKLPVPEQSKIPEPKSRRRRSNSTSSISSQSSVSSQSSTPSSKSQASQDSVQIISTRKSKPVPSTRASLASSLPLAFIRRSAKTQENSNDKKLQPVKALPTSARNKTIQEPTQPPTRTTVPGDETKDDKIPLPATPKLQTSLPVARRRFSLKRPSSNTRSKDSSPRPSNSCSAITTESQTPRSKTEQAKKKDPSLAKRRSFLPTPGRNTQTTKTSARNISSDNAQLLSFSPAVDTKKKTSEESEKVENTDVTSPQSVDDLLQLDDAATLLSDVVSLQPNPVQQFDLIDLSGI